MHRLGFSFSLPNFQTAWDSTSLGWFRRCPTHYRYKMLLGYESRHKSIHLTFGGLYAGALERYAHARASGLDHDSATLDMVRWAMEASGNRDEDGAFVPWTPPADDQYVTYKNRYTLIRSLVWNVEGRKDSPFRTVIKANGHPAVEESFAFEAFEVGGEPILLCGHLDEVVEDTTRPSGDLWIADDKTTKNALTAQYFQTYSPNGQVSLYTIAGGVVLSRPVSGVLIRATQVGVNFNRFATQPIGRPKGVLDEWMRDTQATIEVARTCAERDHWPQNDAACFGCEFRRVCSVSPSHREEWLRTDFVEREWQPLKARGEV